MKAIKLLTSSLPFISDVLKAELVRKGKEVEFPDAVDGDTISKGMMQEYILKDKDKNGNDIDVVWLYV